MRGALRLRLRAREGRVDDTDVQHRTLLDAICPETGRARERWYEQPYQAVARWLGAHPAPLPGVRLTRAHWQRELALEGMQILDDLSTRNWANVRGAERWHWHRVVYLRALVWGLGQLAREFVLEIRARTTPVELIRRTAPRSLAAGGVEHGLLIAAGVVIEPAQINEAVWYAWLDSFGDAPRPDNPVRIALEGAWRKLCARHLPSVAASGDALGPHNWSTPVPEASARTPAPALHEVVPPAAEPLGPEAPRPTPAGASSAPSSSRSNSAAEAATADALLALLADALARGRTHANCAGALVHGVPEGVGLVVPLAWEWLAGQADMDPDEVEAALEGHPALIAEHSSPLHEWGFFVSRGRGSRFRRVRLRLYRRDALPAALAEVVPNPALTARPGAAS